METAICAGDWYSAIDRDRTRFGGAGASEADIDELPDPDHNPGPNEDWLSPRGGPGHARYIADGYEFDGEELEVTYVTFSEYLRKAERKVISMMFSGG